MHTVFLHELHDFSKYYHYRNRNSENGRRKYDESNRNRAPDRRPRPCRYPERDQADTADSRGRPVRDDIGTVGEILFCGKRFSQKKWVELVRNDGK